MCQARTCGRVLARARVQVLQNSGSRMIVFRFTTLSARDRHWRNPRKKNYRERNNTNARDSALTDSLQLTLTTKPQVRISWLKKRYISGCIWQPATIFFAYMFVVLGLFKLSRPDTKYNPLIHTLYSIWERLELKYNHFAHFLLSPSSSSLTWKKWELRTWNLGQIFEIELWMTRMMVGQ